MNLGVNGHGYAMWFSWIIWESDSRTFSKVIFFVGEAIKNTQAMTGIINTIRRLSDTHMFQFFHGPLQDKMEHHIFQLFFTSESIPH